MLRTRILAVACLSALALAGCSSPAGSTPAPAGSASAAVPGGAATATGGLSAVALCDYLRGQLPTLKALSKVGAEAQLAIGLSGFFEKNGKPADGSELDELTIKQCPDVRTDALATIGKGTFAEL